MRVIVLICLCSLLQVYSEEDDIALVSLAGYRGHVPVKDLSKIWKLVETFADEGLSETPKGIMKQPPRRVAYTFDWVEGGIHHRLGVTPDCLRFFYDSFPYVASFPEWGTKGYMTSSIGPLDEPARAELAFLVARIMTHTKPGSSEELKRVFGK